jgi:hypothetical protein
MSSIPKFILRLALSNLLIISSLNIFPQEEPSQKNDQASIGEILVKAGKYCRRLENASLDFVCIEAASEKVDYSKDVPQEESKPVSQQQYANFVTITYPSKLVQENSYVYDYQFTRKGPEKVERRILIKKNGKKMRQENATPLTSALKVQNLLFGPVDLLAPARQSHYQFRVVGKEKLFGQSSCILETIPRFTEDRSRCYGRILLKEDDASVLKIEWEPKSLGQYEWIEARALKYKAKPEMTSITEYGLEKNGIRFPSRDFTEETYIMPNGKKFVRATTVILYKDYKFFTVETDIKY